jgi:general secretion pathway protein J
MDARAQGQSGFTLVEVLIGITLLAMLGTLIANGVRLGGRAWKDAEGRTANRDEMVQLHNLFRRTIIRARPAFASANPRDLTVLFDGEATSLNVVAPQPAREYGGAWVTQRFSIERQGEARALFVTLQRNPPAAANRVLLLDHVSDLRFGYFGPSNAGEAPIWQDSWTSRTRLPDLVRVAIVRDNPRLPAWPELVVGTRVTTSTGCIYSAMTIGCRRVP